MSTHRIDNESSLNNVPGDFKVAGAFTINSGTAAEVSLPTTTGTVGQVPALNGTGGMVWQTLTTGSTNEIFSLNGLNKRTSVLTDTSDQTTVKIADVNLARFSAGLFDLYGGTSQSIFRLFQTNNTASIGLRAPSTGVTSHTLTLPSALPSTTGKALSADPTTGAMSWIDAGGSTDFTAAVPSRYTTGTASATAGVVTGVGLSWSNDMVGGLIRWTTGEMATLLVFNSPTEWQVTPSVTVASGTYTIYYGGFTASNSGVAAATSLNLVGSTRLFRMFASPSQTSTQTWIMPPSAGVPNSLLTNGTGSLGWSYPGTLWGVSVYNTGQAGQAGSTIVTGTGTTWTANMVGGLILWGNGGKAIITAFISTTQLLTGVSQTNVTGGYNLYYGGTYIDSYATSSRRAILTGVTSGALTLAPPASTTTYTLTFPAAVPTVTQALTVDTSGNGSWSTVPIQNGNTIAADLTIGTNDAYGVNIKTNNATVFKLSSTGAITGTSSSWTQAGIPMTFAVVGTNKTNNTTPSVASFTVPNAYNHMRVQMWGGGGGLYGGSGGYSEVSMTVTPGQVYWLIVGQGGQFPNGGNAGGANASGVGGGGGNGVNTGGGGQWSAFAYQSGSNYILMGGAGGGGGGSVSFLGGGAGRNSPTGGGGVAGSGGTGGTGGSSGGGGGVGVSVTTVGLASLNFGGTGGGGGGGAANRSGGGGGYGGGSGNGGGGGNFSPTIGGVVINSFNVLGTNGSASGAAVSYSDANYIGGSGAGGNSSSVGGDGLIVVTLGMFDISAPANHTIASGKRLNLNRFDNAQTVAVKTDDATGSWMMTVPTSAGLAGQVLNTDGTGITNWVNRNDAQSVTISTAATIPNSAEFVYYTGAGADTLTLPTATLGHRFYLVSTNSAPMLTGATVYDSTGAAVTTAPVSRLLMFMSNGTNWYSNI